jgi:predicted metal-dependent RNase
MHPPRPWRSPRVAEKGGVIMIAAFAVGRAGTLMLHVSRLRSSSGGDVRIRIQRELGRRARVPEYLERISLEDPR